MPKPGKTLGYWLLYYATKRRQAGTGAHEDLDEDTEETVVLILFIIRGYYILMQIDTPSRWTTALFRCHTASLPFTTQRRVMHDGGSHEFTHGNGVTLTEAKVVYPGVTAARLAYVLRSGESGDAMVVAVIVRARSGGGVVSGVVWAYESQRGH